MRLYYVMDPMCSWCWGFRPVFQQLLGHLSEGTEIRYVMGGLAPDTDEPMSPETRDYVQSQWRAVAAQTGAMFNWDFWSECQPRRATYLACRAVISAGRQDKDAVPRMIHAIQKAYYRQARNPSDEQTLIELATEIDLDESQFAHELNSDVVNMALQDDLSLRNKLGVTHFPSVLVEHNGKTSWLASGDSTIEQILGHLIQALATDN